MSIYEMSPTELFDTYAEGIDPADLVAEGRNNIAIRLRADEGLSQEAAFHVTDQILIEAERRLNTPQEGSSSQ